MGDFDSYENPQLNIETITLPREKDDTEPELCLGVMLGQPIRHFQQENIRLAVVRIGIASDPLSIEGMVSSGGITFQYGFGDDLIAVGAGENGSQDFRLSFLYLLRQRPKTP